MDSKEFQGYVKTSLDHLTEATKDIRLDIKEINNIIVGNQLDIKGLKVKAWIFCAIIGVTVAGFIDYVLNKLDILNKLPMP